MKLSTETETQRRRRSLRTPRLTWWRAAAAAADKNRANAAACVEANFRSRFLQVEVTVRSRTNSN